jgi:flavin-dependent dehydrogenase
MPGTLDTALKEQALALGAELVFNRRVGDVKGGAIVGTGPARANVVAVGMTFTTTASDLAAVAFGDDLAPGGYAYLLVNQGCGTMASVLYLDYRQGNECFERAKRFFAERSGLDIRDEKRFGSFGDFFISGTRADSGRLHVGESAGFQDFLWGFGLRYAMVSGGLAASSIIGGADYDALWKRQFKPMLETSLVNRYLFEKLGNAGYRYLTRRFAGGDPCGYLRRHYNGPFFKRLLLPVAKRGCRKRLTGRRHTAPGASEPGIERP